MRVCFWLTAQGRADRAPHRFGKRGRDSVSDLAVLRRHRMWLFSFSAPRVFDGKLFAQHLSRAAQLLGHGRFAVHLFARDRAAKGAVRGRTRLA